MYAPGSYRVGVLATLVRTAFLAESNHVPRVETYNAVDL